MRVREAARRLGYTPNAFARGLKLQRTNTLGLVLPDVANPTNALLVQGLERRASHHGYVVLLADMDDFAANGEVYRRLVLERRVDGLIVSGLMHGHGFVDDLNNHRIPYVLVDCQPTPGAVCVSANDTDGIALAVDHLVGLGHQRIANLVGFAQDGPSGCRLDGYRAAMGRHGLPEHHVIAEVEVSEAGGYKATTRLLDREPSSTAVIVAGVMQGVGAMAAIRETGRAVPSGMSIVALQDAPLAAYLDPPLTAIRRPSREVAEAAVDVLIKLISGVEAGDVVVPIPPKLIVRASTAAPIGAG
jgi:LacI family transcriptional regulator